jgi:hypothetical protein
MVGSVRVDWMNGSGRRPSRSVTKKNGLQHIRNRNSALLLSLQLGCVFHVVHTPNVLGEFKCSEDPGGSGCGAEVAGVAVVAPPTHFPKHNGS